MITFNFFFFNIYIYIYIYIYMYSVLKDNADGGKVGKTMMTK